MATETATSIGSDMTEFILKNVTPNYDTTHAPPGKHRAGAVVGSMTSHVSSTPRRSPDGSEVILGRIVTACVSASSFPVDVSFIDICFALALRRPSCNLQIEFSTQNMLHCHTWK